MAQAGCRGSREQYAGCAVCAHSALGALSRVGLGHVGQRAGALSSEALRLSHGVERPHSSGDAEGGRERNVSHRNVHCLSATGTGGSALAWAVKGTLGKIARCTRTDRRTLYCPEESACSCRLNSGELNCRNCIGAVCHEI